jgi:hypothetical protein
LFGRLNKSSWRYDGLTVLPVLQFTASDYLLSNLINIRVNKNSKSSLVQYQWAPGIYWSWISEWRK